MLELKPLQSSVERVSHKKAVLSRSPVAGYTVLQCHPNSSLSPGPFRILSSLLPIILVCLYCPCQKKAVLRNAQVLTTKSAPNHVFSVLQLHHLHRQCLGLTLHISFSTKNVMWWWSTYCNMQAFGINLLRKLIFLLLLILLFTWCCIFSCIS